ncbi:hypothetical protein [Labilibacter marinus]|uniref:hypothetical protein n=1 Tax=Labilibacter marinus TaxID=1477105 RepID=UPI0008323D48|nr:hypothetical protein [Labilibacter marinus]
MNDSVTLKRLLLYFIPFVPSFIFGWLGNNAAMGTSAAIGLIILLIINIDKLQSFKGLGIEAKMKDLSNLINEGNIIFEKLKDVAVGISEPTLNQLAYKLLSLTQGPNPSHIADQYENIIVLLTKLNIEKKKIDTAGDLFSHVFKNKIINVIKYEVSQNKSDYDEKLLEELNSIKIEVENDDSRNKFITQLNKFPNLNDKIKKLLSTYKTFSESGKIENRDLLDQK